MKTTPARIQRFPLLAIVCLLGFALLLTACGETTTTAGATNPPTATTAPTDTPSPAPTNTPAPTGPQVAISIIGSGTYAFDPASKSVKVGTTVTWTNNSSAPHTVTSDTGPDSFDGQVSSGDKFSFTFTKAGTYTYHCSIHPYMHGTITVTA